MKHPDQEGRITRADPPCDFILSMSIKHISITFVGELRMIQAVVKMVIPSDKQEEGLNILRSVAQRSRAETGCISCSVYQETENDHAIIYEEVWRGEDELQHHLGREEYQKVLLVMEMSCKPPEIRFNTIKSIEGVEVIERARTAHKQAKTLKRAS
jgi:quinol monooxygenase YgiN